MFKAHKAEHETEEVKDKVRTRSAATTEVVDGSKELSNQITKLMAALRRAEKGNHPVSVSNSPEHRGCGRGWMDRNTPTYPSSHNGQTGLGQTISTHSSSALSRAATVPQGKGSAQRPKDGQGSIQSMKDPSSLQCFRCQGWGHRLGSALLQPRC